MQEWLQEFSRGGKIFLFTRSVNGGTIHGNQFLFSRISGKFQTSK